MLKAELVTALVVCWRSAGGVGSKFGWRLSRGGRRSRAIAQFLVVASASFVLSVALGCGASSPPTQPSATDREIQHAMGTTYVPKSVERLLTADTAALDAALALDVTPVGSAVYGDFPRYLGDRVEGIESVGEGTQPNLETIARLQPDLILGNKINSGNLYRRLSQIAPTVLSEGSGRSGNWQQHFRLYGEALGRGDAARDRLQTYEQRVEQLRQQLGNPGTTTVSVVATGQGRVGVYTTESFSGSILQNLGFARPEIQTDAGRWAKVVSREQLDKLDGDIIFLIHDENSSGSLTRSELVSDPVWSQLSAVERDRVYEVDAEVWTAGRSFLAALQILDDVERAVGERS